MFRSLWRFMMNNFGLLLEINVEFGCALDYGFHLHNPFDLMISDYVELNVWCMGALLHLACLRSVLCKVLRGFAKCTLCLSKWLGGSVSC